MQQYHRWLILIALGAALFFRELGTRDLVASHEARAAQNAQMLLNDGQWELPRLYDGQIEMQKPPGYYWLVAALAWLPGQVDAWTVRLPSALAALGLVLLLFRWLSALGRQGAGFWAAIILATAVHFTGTARIGRIDMVLAFTVALVLYLSECYQRVAPSYWALGRYSVYLGTLGAISLLLKGPIGLLLPCPVVALWVLIERRSFWRYTALGATGLLCSLLLAGPWFYQAHVATNGEFTRVFFGYHYLNRAFGGAEALASHPWWYYAPRFGADFLPWSPLLLWALIDRSWRREPMARAGLIWLAVMVIGLSCSRFKRADYLLPAYPGAAILIGCFVDTWLSQRLPRVRVRWVALALGLIAMAPIGWTVFDRTIGASEESKRAQDGFAKAIREPYPEREITLFRVESHLLSFHLGRPVRTEIHWEYLWELVKSQPETLVVIRAELYNDFIARIPRTVKILGRSEDFSREKPLRPLLFLKVTQ